MQATFLQAVVVFLAGILAGEEFIVRYGIHPALRNLDDRAHVNARIALVLILRFVVPSVMIPTLLAVVAMLVFDGDGAGATFRWAGAAAFGAYLLISFLVTGPLNAKVEKWQADNPPANWKDVVRRWQRIDVLRSTAAIFAFLGFVIALADSV